MQKQYYEMSEFVEFQILVPHGIIFDTVGVFGLAFHLLFKSCLSILCEMKSETEVTTTVRHSRISVPHCFDEFLTRLANKKLYMVMRALSKFR